MHSIAKFLLSASLMVVSAASTLAQAPLDFSKLIPFLPAAPTGWAAGEANGSTTDAGGFKLSVAGRTYTKADVPEDTDAPTASVNITDCSGSKEFLATTTTGWKDTGAETTDGYAKTKTIDGNPAFETYDKSAESAMLWIIVSQRFLVQLEVTRQPPAELQNWLKLVDIKKLASLK